MLRNSCTPYDALRPLMAKYGAKCNPEEFYWAVNLAYHSVESGSYEKLHSDMFSGLPVIWKKLLGVIPDHDVKLRILDIGSGTGLVGTLIDQIAHTRVLDMTLLDPCPDMIERAKLNSRNWRFPCRFVVGRPEKIEGETFDAVTMNSVMHHVPDLPQLCEVVKQYLKRGGYLITAQDPREGFDEDPIYKKRAWMARKSRSTLFARLSNPIRKFARNILKGPFISPIAADTSRRLMAAGIIDKPMEAQIIWSITDFHVPRQPFGIGRGININDLGKWLEVGKPLAYFTYQYFGIPYADLTDEEKKRELDLLDSDDAHGEIFASVWGFGERADHHAPPLQTVIP